MSYLVACDNVDLMGNFTSCVYTQEVGAFWLTQLSLFNPVSAKGICVTDNGYVIALETRSKSSLLVQLNRNLDIIKTISFSKLMKIRAICADDNKVYVASQNYLLSISLSLTGSWSIEYESELQITGAAIKDGIIIVTESNFAGRGCVKSLNGDYSNDSCSEPWSPIFRGSEIIYVDGLKSELFILGSTLVSHPIKVGYPRVVVSIGNRLDVFFNNWRRYKRDNMFRGHWSRVPDWFDGKKLENYSSGIATFQNNVLINTLLTGNYWNECSGAVEVDLPSNSFLISDDASLAAYREKKFLNYTGVLRKKIHEVSNNN